MEKEIKNLQINTCLKVEKEKMGLFWQSKNNIVRLGILSLLLLLSIFYEPIIFLALLFSMYLILRTNNIKSIYILSFLIPVSTLFEFQTLDLMQFIVAEVVVLCGINFIKDVLLKKKKFSITREVFLLLILIFFIVQINNNNFVGSCGIFCGLLIVYFVSYYYSECDFKEISVYFIFGIVLSIALGLFRPVSEKLASLTPVFYAGSMKRFSGVSHPNILAGEIVFALSLLFSLVLLKKTKSIFYFLYMACYLALCFTLSKSGLLIFIFSSLLFLIFYLIFDFYKFKLLKVVVGITVTIALFFSLGNVTKEYLNRFTRVINNSQSNIEEIVIPSVESGFVEEDNEETDIMEELTTGRSVLWKNYLHKSFQSLKSSLFGYGINALSTEDNGSGQITNAHNTIIQILYFNGLVGLILIIGFLLSCLNYKSINKNWLFLMIPLGALGLFSMSASLYNYTLFCLGSIIIIGLNNSGKNEIILKKKISQGLKAVDDLGVKIAILTPTYNRENLLERCYNSLVNQTNKNFVWYVVDDGSTDNTENLIKKYIKANEKNKDFKISYIKKSNGGKHTAINTGLKAIKEDYVIILDSDDTFIDKAVEIMAEDLPIIAQDNSLCGIGYLRVDKNNKIIGCSYVEDGIIDTFVNQRYNCNTYGDKCELYKTEILRQYPFPEFKDEKFLSEAIVWCQISGSYKMVFFNKGIYCCEYQPNGLSDGVHKRLFKNPKGASECYKVLSTKGFRFKLRIKYTIAYIVYSLAANMELKEMKKNHPDNKMLINILYLPSKLYFKKLQRKFK